MISFLTVSKQNVPMLCAAYLCPVSECEQQRNNNSSSSSCKSGRGLKVEGRGVCCCDWTWVRGNATHAWTHRPAHSCAKNTLLLFSGHGSGRDPKKLGQGVMGSYTPLCVVLSRGLAKLSWVSCLYVKITMAWQPPPHLSSRMSDFARHPLCEKVKNTALDFTSASW